MVGGGLLFLRYALSILAGLAAVFLLITRRAARKSYMAYAPYLSLAALAALFLVW
ncbi:MAG: hypothetical protein ACP5TV_06020 [Anaerolineae bacterium]